jgi:hypothetical protein
MEKTAIILQNEEEKTLPSRESVLLCLEECRRDLKNKLDHGRFKSPALERERNAKAKILISCCQVMAAIMKDADLDDLKRRLDDLERGSR